MNLFGIVKRAILGRGQRDSPTANSIPTACDVSTAVPIQSIGQEPTDPRRNSPIHSSQLFPFDSKSKVHTILPSRNLEDLESKEGSKEVCMAVASPGGSQRFANGVLSESVFQEEMKEEEPGNAFFDSSAAIRRLEKGLQETQRQVQELKQADQQKQQRIQELEQADQQKQQRIQELEQADQELKQADQQKQHQIQELQGQIETLNSTVHATLRPIADFTSGRIRRQARNLANLQQRNASLEPMARENAHLRQRNARLERQNENVVDLQERNANLNHHLCRALRTRRQRHNNEVRGFFH